MWRLASQPACLAALILAACSEGGHQQPTPVTVARSAVECTLTAGQVTCTARKPVGLALVPDSTPLGHAASVPMPEKVLSVFISPVSTRACAIGASTQLYCWGASVAPHNEQPTKVFPPALLAGVSNVREVSISSGVNCAREDDGSVWCWGRLGTTGIKGLDYSASPVKLPNLQARSIAADFIQTCVLAADGAHCWGGQRPSQGRQVRIEEMTLIEFTGGATSLKAENGQMCVVWPDKQEDCWSTTPFPDDP